MHQETSGLDCRSEVKRIQVYRFSTATKLAVERDFGNYQGAKSRSSLCVCQHAQIKHTVLRSLMGKKKSGSNKASVKEAKKAKTAAKVERKEAKAQKQSKGRDAEDDEDDDLEGILERVRSNSKD